MLKIVIILVSAALFIALTILFIHLVKDMAGEKISSAMAARNTQQRLKQDPETWEFWRSLTGCTVQLEELSPPAPQKDTPEWKKYRERQTRIVSLLQRVRTYIETQPEDVTRLQGLGAALPVVHDFFKGYHACLSLGADTPGGQEYLGSVQEGFEHVEEIVNNYIDLLLQNKSAGIRAETGGLLKGFDGNIDTPPGSPRDN